MRRNEVTSWDSMQNLIQDVWKSIEFEKTESEQYGSWCGINHLVENVVDTMKECILKKGYDTHFMKN